MIAPYIGRFAPTPSGPLHFGSLLAAVGSYCAARHAGGQWQLRIDDLDTARNADGAVDAILRTLDAAGLHWDGEVIYQSQHRSDYLEALQVLKDKGLTYACACTRKSVGKGPYPGTCAKGLKSGQAGRSIRLRVSDEPIQFIDQLQGEQSVDLRQECGDFIIRRADQVISYHLATVVDDARQGISHVVRGCDLLSCSARQRYIQQLLGLAELEYTHLPLICNQQGQKLSKQHDALALTVEKLPETLTEVLRLLGQETPAQVSGSATDILDNAISHWQQRDIPPEAEIKV